MDKRAYGLDLLRIISMFMVVVFHSLNHGGLVEGALVPGTFNFYACNVLYALCLVAVNCFIMISGYFLCTANYNLKKMIFLWSEAIFYSVLGYVISVASTNITFSMTGFIKSFMVLSLKRYWFFTAYLLLYMSIPFLNAAIKQLNKTTHLIIVCVSLFVFCVLHNIVYTSDFGGINGGSSFLWFCILYVLAAYIRLYVPKKVRRQTLTLPIYFCACFVVASERFLAYVITPMVFGKVTMASLFFSYNSIFCVLGTICIFQYFRGIEIKTYWMQKVINIVAPLTFAVYLIHDQSDIRQILWNYLGLYNYAQSSYLLLKIITISIGIFVICCFFDKIRKIIVEKSNINKHILLSCNNIEKWIYSKFQERIHE